MKRAISYAAAIAALSACFALVANVRAAVPQMSSNEWTPTGDMTRDRAGASASLLGDGHVLITGGFDESGIALASAERYSPELGGFVVAAPMETPRAYHTSTVLSDGRVLVAGGADGNGRAVASTEVYDPATNSWSYGAPMNVARRGHTATSLGDGRVVISGGDDAGVSLDSIEIFDPATAAFVLADRRLTAARTMHAAASLPDPSDSEHERVLIAGGYDGINPLATTDVYDARTGSVMPGPAMSTPRAGLSATTLADGRVLVAGGANLDGALASAEVFDSTTDAFVSTGSPLAAPRQNHIALLLPHNNQVLIVGGLAGGSAVSSAELYTPWDGEGGVFCSLAVCASGFAGPPPTATGRAWATGVALSYPASAARRSGPNDGLALVAGGTGLKSGELYRFATVGTDRYDYAPGDVVTITGSGWQPGEWVALVLKESPDLDEHPLVDVQADENGNILSTEFSPDEHDLDVHFTLTAFGEISQAQTTFSDSANKASFADTAGGTPITTFGTFGANACRDAFVQARQGNNPSDGTFSPRTVGLSSSPAGATFYAGPGCTGTPTTNVSIPSAPANSTPFSFSVATPGSYTINGDAAWASTPNDATAAVTIVKANQTIAVTTATPLSAAFGSTFAVAATASSNLPVAITTDGGCSGSGSGSATIAMTSSTTTCVVHFNQAGNAGYNAAPEVTSSTTATKASQTITFGPLTDRTYGDPAFVVSATGGGSGNAVSFASTTASICSTSGTNGTTVTILAAGGCSIRASQSGNLNYDDAPEVTQSFTVHRATPVFSALSAATITYGDGPTALGGTLAASTLIPTGGVGVTVNGVTQFGAIDPVTGAFAVSIATQPFPATGSPYTIAYSYAGDPNFAPASDSTKLLAVHRRPISIAADARQKVYGNGDPALTYQITSGSLVNGDSFAGNLTRATGEGVGEYVIQQGSLTLSDNYALTFVGAILTITPRPITVAADAKSKVYGDDDPVLTYQITSGSLVSGDSFAGALTRATGQAVGDYAIEQGSLAVSANYDLTFVGAILTIVRRPLAVTADDASKTYDGQPFAPFTASFSGFAVGEGPGVLGGSLAFSGTATTAINQGSYVITPGGLTSPNYAMTFVNGTLTINKRPITIKADDKTKPFGTPDPPLTYQLVAGSLVAGDAVTGVLSRTPGETVGVYPILQNTVTAGPNYALTYQGANLTIASWTLYGFYQPVSMSPPGGPVVFNSIKGGQTVPLKFKLYQSVNGPELTSISDVQSTTLAPVACTNGSLVEDVDPASLASTGATTLRYDGTQFIQNWQTPNSAKQCYRVTMTARDGSTLNAYFITK